MKNTIIGFLIVALSIFGEKNACSQTFPTAQSPVEFDREAENFIIGKAEKGESLTDIYNRTSENSLKEDRRDWETPLARIIADPDKYGLRASELAFWASNLRKTADDPKVVAATRQLFEAQVREAVRKSQSLAAENKPKDPLIAIGLGGNASQILNVGTSENLSLILDYINSADENIIGLMETSTPVEIEKAFRSYGDHHHIDGVKRLAMKLLEAGKDDISDDLDRSIKRIKQAPKNDKLSAIREGDISSANGDSGREVEDGNENGNLIIWLVGVIATVSAILFGISVIKRRI